MPAHAESCDHARIKSEISSICKALGFETREEVRGDRWRADVLAIKGAEQIAFEVQISSQTLAKTLERQERYIQSGVKGCWLFQNPVAKHLAERPDLPLFYVSSQDNVYVVSLIDGRKQVLLSEFVKAMLQNDIRFCEFTRTKNEQNVKINFFEYECWHCNAANHIFYVEELYCSACNFIIEELETLWEGEKREFRPEILDTVRQFLQTEQGKALRVGEIKPRYSNTVSHAYRSFGCYECDSIFGDWYVMNDTLDARNGYYDLVSFETTVTLPSVTIMPLPHWCYPENSL